MSENINTTLRSATTSISGVAILELEKTDKQERVELFIASGYILVDSSNNKVVSVAERLGNRYDVILVGDSVIYNVDDDGNDDTTIQIADKKYAFVPESKVIGWIRST
jgi:hypothetical protein